MFTCIASDGIGLAFIAFPTIISEAPAGAIIGVLFFGSLVLAGFTSMISILLGPAASLQEKFGLSRRASAARAPLMSASIARTVACCIPTFAWATR